MMDKKRDQKGLTEQEFLEAYKKKNYPRPYLTADLVLLSDTGEVLLVQRKGHPFLGCWALPGGFAKADETVAETAVRELREETGAETAPEALIPLGLYSKPGRDPRGWVVTQAYLAILPRGNVCPAAGDDAADAAWFRLKLDREKRVWLEHDGLRLELNGASSDLAFDHGEILTAAYKLYFTKKKEWIYV
jgi:ADP-ribose pyrophosphatase YjhB (NUDIX family)